MAGSAGSKPLKIRRVSDPVKVGIVASDIKEVIERGLDKLNIPVRGASVCLEADGTLVNDEDYFQTLERDTCLVLLGAGQTWTGINNVQCEITRLLQKLADKNVDNIRDVMDQKPSETQRLFVEFISSRASNIDAECIEEDRDWFEDLEPQYTTKSKYMFDRAKERIRGYYSKTKEMLSNGQCSYSRAAQVRRDWVLQSLRDDLKANRYHGVCFDRTSGSADRLCNGKGWFRCQGAYDIPKCTHDHLVNPYSTKESMVFFSTWNLDHIIEKSRSVIPGLLQAIRDCPAGKEVNVAYFYKLLFTRKNLKLVDIRCHKKGKHTGKVEKKSFYRQVCVR